MFPKHDLVYHDHDCDGRGRYKCSETIIVQQALRHKQKGDKHEQARQKKKKKKLIEDKVHPLFSDVTGTSKRIGGWDTRTVSRKMYVRTMGSAHQRSQGMVVLFHNEVSSSIPLVRVLCSTVGVFQVQVLDETGGGG